MYRLIRNAHLILGMAGILFVLTYAISSVQMAHRIRAVPQVTQTDLTLPAGLAPRALAEALMQQRGYGGELGKPQATPKGFRIALTRPGTNIAVNYETASGLAHVRHESRSWLGMLNRLHHQNGVHHEDARLNAWGWALAIVWTALLALGASGVYLWFQMHQERVTGAILLSTNLLVSLGLLAALRW